jgi:hypothetical protein
MGKEAMDLSRATLVSIPSAGKCNAHSLIQFVSPLSDILIALANFGSLSTNVPPQHIGLNIPPSDYSESKVDLSDPKIDFHLTISNSRNKDGNAFDDGLLTRKGKTVQDDDQKEEEEEEEERKSSSSSTISSGEDSRRPSADQLPRKVVRGKAHSNPVSPANTPVSQTLPISPANKPTFKLNQTLAKMIFNKSTANNNNKNTNTYLGADNNKGHSVIDEDEKVKLMVKNGTLNSRNKNGEIPLTQAVKDNNMNLLRSLITAGAHINGVNKVSVFADILPPALPSTYPVLIYLYIH